MVYNMRPTFKAIRLFERMTHTSFLDLESNPELIFSYLYCCLIAHPENNFKLTYEDALELFFPKHAQELIEQFTKEMSIINQFKDLGDDSKTPDDSSIKTPENSSPRKEGNVYLSSVIPILVSECKLDINYVMNEMDYTDVDFYIKNLVESKHDDMETQRFWTYFQIAPHIDGKKIKGPEDLIEFPWEKDERKHEAEEKMKLDWQKLIDIGFIKEDSSLNKNEES